MKTALLGIMGGIFVGIAFLAYFQIGALKASDGSYIAGTWIHKLIGSIIFPVGIIMVVYMGGSLFTSDSLLVILVLNKKTSIWNVLSIWGNIFVTNFIGMFLIAALAYGFGAFDSDIMHKQLITAANSKADMTWYKTLLSGILCNFIVAGSVFMANGVKRNGVKLFLIHLSITTFVLLGLQHVVANMFVFAEGWMVDASGFSTSGAFFNNLIPAAIGNVIGGGVIIPLVYFGMNHISNKKVSKEQE